MKAKNNLLFLLIILLTFNLTNAAAQELSQEEINDIISAYRKYKDVSELSLSVPTVVEISLDEEFIERFDFAVLDKTMNFFEPYFFNQEVLTNQIPISIGTNIPSGEAQKMIDDKISTYTDFDLPENARGEVQISLTSPKIITSSGLTILLDDHVALPNTIEIRANNKIVVASKKMVGQTIYFPETTSDNWLIKLTYGQPLRITELRLDQKNAIKVSSRTIRFLAQPNRSYRIYLDPDRKSDPPVGEKGNLESDKDVLRASAMPSQSNPNYIIADIDKDGIADIYDNCVSEPNTNQEDVNGNGRGDVCDDFDKDGLINSKDNCPNHPNRNQSDTDGDGIGDLCDKEESRITERYKWLPWLGIIFAAAVIVILFVLTAKPTKDRKENQ